MDKAGDTDKNTGTVISDKNNSVSNEVDSNLYYKNIENINAKDVNMSPGRSRSNGLMLNNDIKTSFEDISYQFKTKSSINNFDNILARGQLYINNCMSTINQIIGDEENSENSNNDDSADIGKKIVSDAATDSVRPLRIITREEWGAEPPMNELDPLELPAIRVIIAHTVFPFPRTERECKIQCQNIQDYHTDGLRFSDISYNFLIGGDGVAYVGRGWDKEGQHTNGYNARSIGIAFMGKFCRIKPEERQLTAAKKLIEEGVKLGKIDKNYKLYGHRQLKATVSPGKALFSIITTWEHWSVEIL